MTTMRLRLLCVPFLCSLLAMPLAGTASALVPVSVGVEGLLQSSGGGPAADGDYAVTFALYKDAAGGVAIWSEGPVALAVKNGQFTHALGTKTPLTQQVLAAAGAQAFLGVQIGSDPELARKPLNSVATALRAAAAESLECSGCIGLGHLDAQALAPYAKTADLAKVALSGKFADLEGGPDLSAYAKTAALAKVAFSGAYADLTGVPDLAAYAKTAALAKVATTGKYADLADAPLLADVATTGKYADLDGLPALAKLGEACGTGLVMKGLKADGSYECVAALDPTALPGDGLNEISNGLLTNEFADIANGTKGVKIPDNNPVGVSDTIDFPDVGLARKLTVNVDLSNSKINTLTVALYDAANNEYVLHQKSGSGTSLKTSWPTPTKTVSGDLTTWVGKNPKGKWFLKVVDADYLNNATDGQINAWSIQIETLSNKKVQVKGDLIVDGKAIIGGETYPKAPAQVKFVRAKGGQTYCAGSYQNINGLQLSITTTGGPLRITGDVPVYYGSHTALRAVVDGKYAGEFSGLPWSYVWQDGLQCTSCPGCGNWTNLRYDRVFPGIPAGSHTVNLQIYTDGACASCGIVVGNGSMDGWLSVQEVL